MPDPHHQIWLVRHGETEWSASGQHTGRTDIPLTPAGERQAAALGRLLAKRPFALVLSSPLGRARETCRLAGYGDVAVIADDLREWDYGDYEGRKTVDIRKEAPGWTVWAGPLPQRGTYRAGGPADATGHRPSGGREWRRRPLRPRSRAAGACRVLAGAPA